MSGAWILGSAGAIPLLEPDRLTCRVQSKDLPTGLVVGHSGSVIVAEAAEAVGLGGDDRGRYERTDALARSDKREPLVERPPSLRDASASRLRGARSSRPPAPESSRPPRRSGASESWGRCPTSGRDSYCSACPTAVPETGVSSRDAQHRRPRGSGVRAGPHRAATGGTLRWRAVPLAETPCGRVRAASAYARRATVARLHPGDPAPDRRSPIPLLIVAEEEAHMRSPARFRWLMGGESDARGGGLGRRGRVTLRRGLPVLWTSAEFMGGSGVSVSVDVARRSWHSRKENVMKVNCERDPAAFGQRRQERAGCGNEIRARRVVSVCAKANSGTPP